MTKKRLATTGPILMSSHSADMTVSLASGGNTCAQAVYSGGRGYAADESIVWFNCSVSQIATGPNLTFGRVKRSEYGCFSEYSNGGNTTPHLWNRLTEFLQAVHDLQNEDIDSDGVKPRVGITWAEIYGGRIPFGADSSATWKPYGPAGIADASINYLATHATNPVQWWNFMDADGATGLVFPTRVPNGFDPNLMTFFRQMNLVRQELFNTNCPVTTAGGSAVHTHKIGDHFQTVLTNATGMLANYELTGGNGSVTSVGSGNTEKILFTGDLDTSTGVKNLTLPSSRGSNLTVAISNSGWYLALLRDTVDRSKVEVVAFQQITSTGATTGTVNIIHRGWSGTTAQSWTAATTEMRLFKFDEATWGTYAAGEWSKTVWKSWLGRPGPTAIVAGFVSTAAPNATGDASNNSFGASTYKLWNAADTATGTTHITSGPPLHRPFLNYYGLLKLLPPASLNGPGTGTNANKWPYLTIDSENRWQLTWLDKASLPWNTGTPTAQQLDEYLRRVFCAFAILQAEEVITAHATMPWISYGVKIADWMNGLNTMTRNVVEATGSTTAIDPTLFYLETATTMTLTGVSDVPPDAPDSCLSNPNAIAGYFTYGGGRQYRSRFQTGYTSARLEVEPDFETVDGDPRGVYSNGITNDKMTLLRNLQNMGMGLAMQITGKSTGDPNEDNNAALRISEWMIDNVAPISWEAANSTRGNGATGTDRPTAADAGPVSGLDQIVGDLGSIEVWTGGQRITASPVIGATAWVASADDAAKAAHIRKRMTTAAYRRRAVPGRKG
jgi:hypothetical protein